MHLTGLVDVEFAVPDDLFSLAVELEDEAAAAAHAAFIDARLPGSAPVEMRQQMLDQLAAARAMLQRDGLRYLGLASAEVDDHWAFCLVGIGVTAFDPPPAFEPGNFLAALVRDRYPAAEALVEEFTTHHGPAVGLRRCDQLTIPVQVHEGQPQQIDTGVAQVMVAFPAVGALGLVTGFCLDLRDLDVVTVLAGAIAQTLRVAPINPAVAGGGRTGRPIAGPSQGGCRRVSGGRRWRWAGQ